MSTIQVGYRNGKYGDRFDDIFRRARRSAALQRVFDEAYRRDMTCPNCGGKLLGDGWRTRRHCERVDAAGEPDADPLYCTKDTV